ncbi:MAG: TetR family transcriptional regulator [Myxococcales bacterium]|nr:TetR family transcriptional regulator [Myxococcales bacterium]
MVSGEERADRIVTTAVELAGAGGFEAVRLRDVASNAGVALGTLYRHFHSKEDLLVAALARESDAVERHFELKPARGETALERLTNFFRTTTRMLCRRPKLLRAVLRAAASGDPGLAERVERFHRRSTQWVVAALRGESFSELRGPEQDVAELLQQVWFALLVGWAGGLHSQAEIVEKVRTAAEILLRGAGLDGRSG